MSGWSEIMQNQKGYTLKKFLAQILHDKVNHYDDLIARIAFHLITENDLKLFAELANDLVTAGYFKAVDEYKPKLKDLGIEITVKEAQSEKLGW
jgi:hypothetical protein